MPRPGRTPDGEKPIDGGAPRAGARLPESGASDVLYLVDLSGYVFRAYHAIPPSRAAPASPPTRCSAR